MLKPGKAHLGLLASGTSSSKTAGSGHVFPFNCKNMAKINLNDLSHANAMD